MLVELKMVEDLMDLGLSLNDGVFTKLEGSLVWGKDIKVTLGSQTSTVNYHVYSWNCEGDLEYDRKGEAVLSNDNLISFLKELGCRSERESKKERDEWLKKLEMKRAMMSK